MTVPINYQIHFMCTGENCNKFKKTKILTFGVDVEQSQSSFVGMQNDTHTLENSLAVSYNM